MNGQKPIILRIISIGTLIVALVLEALPKGVALKFAPAPNEVLMQYYSYFSTTPFGYANFAPLITAILTVLLTLCALALIFIKRDLHKLRTALCVATIVTAVISACPILYGLDYVTVLGAIITLLITASAVFCAISNGKTNRQ